MSSCRFGFFIVLATSISSLIRRYCLVAEVNNRSVPTVYGWWLNRYLRPCLYIFDDDDKSPNRCLATVEAFINFLVLKFILYLQKIISRYDEWTSLNKSPVILCCFFRNVDVSIHSNSKKMQFNLKSGSLINFKSIERS